MFVSSVVLVASWEWGAFVGLKNIRSRVGYLSVIVSIILGLCLLLGITPTTESINLLGVLITSWLGLLFWIMTFSILKNYPRNAERWNNKYKILTMGILALLPAWVGLIQLKYLLAEGYLVLALVALVAAVDIGAYFAGKQFGHKKLAPNVSPNKSWEGVWGGLGLCFLLNIVLIWVLNNYLQPLSALQIILLILSSLAVTFFDIIGDLFESMLKRNRHIKDSGALLPGHGGVLDRVDGLIAVTPSFVLIVLFALDGIE
jgi:phosphatidate cytidylyltransferase